MRDLFIQTNCCDKIAMKNDDVVNVVGFCVCF